MIRVPAPLLDDIAAQAERAFPRECCGLLVGRVAADGAVSVNRVVASPNVAQGPGLERFEVDPKIRFDLMRALEDTAEVIVGHYHSHPGYPAEPSATDLDMAYEPQFVWLIAAVDASGRAGGIRAWRLNRDTRERRELPLQRVEIA